MRSRQSGSVLAISLVLLTAITLIAMMNMQRSGLQTKIVANLQHHEMAFNQSTNIAESALNALQAMEYETKREFLVNAQRAYYSHKEGNSASNEILYSTHSSNPLITNSVTISHEPSRSIKEEYLTTGIRSQFSRGKNLNDIPRFELVANSRLPNGIQSTQAFGFNSTPK